MPLFGSPGKGVFSSDIATNLKTFPHQQQHHTDNLLATLAFSSQFSQPALNSHNLLSILTTSSQPFQPPRNPHNLRAIPLQPWPIRFFNSSTAF